MYTKYIINFIIILKYNKILKAVSQFYVSVCYYPQYMVIVESMLKRHYIFNFYEKHGRQYL